MQDFTLVSFAGWFLIFRYLGSLQDYSENEIIEIDSQ